MNAFARVENVTRSVQTGGSAVIDYLRSRLLVGGGSSENIHAVYLDRTRSFVGERFIRGSSSGSFRARTREILADALVHEASGMIIAHNHPSELCQPSRADIDATRRLSEIARALDIQLLDHFIITSTNAYSMRAGGQI